MTKRRKKFLGEDRALMFLQNATRRLWKYYGKNRNQAYEEARTKISRRGGYWYECQMCHEYVEKHFAAADHIKPVGGRAYTIEDYPAYWKRMFRNKCQILCRTCNRKKGDKE